MSIKTFYTQNVWFSKLKHKRGNRLIIAPFPCMNFEPFVNIPNKESKTNWDN